MKKIERIRWLALLVLFGGILASCSFPSAQPAEKSQLTIQATPALADAATLKLEIQADTSVPIGVEGQIVKVSYLIKNTGTTSIIKLSEMVNPPGLVIIRSASAITSYILSIIPKTFTPG